jgi:hypothetical protein
MCITDATNPSLPHNQQYCGAITADECKAYWKTVVDKLKDTTAYKNQQIYDIGGINDPLGGSGFLEAVTQVRNKPK